VRLVLELVTRFIEEKEATSEIIIISKKQVLQRYIQGREYFVLTSNMHVEVQVRFFKDLSNTCDAAPF
jgi:hypothetical protein